MPASHIPNSSWMQCLDFSAREHAGFGRERQEDRVYTTLEMKELGMTLQTDHLEAAGLLFVLADGMGGEGHGEVASETACYAVLQTYKDYLQSPSDPETFFQQALKDAYLAIRARVEKNPKLEGMGTTLTMLLIKQEDVYSCHIGDSRIYRHRRGAQPETALEQQSTDHLEKGERHVLSQAVGLKEMLPPGIPAEDGHIRRLQPDTRHFSLQFGTDDLIVCSDGLWSVVSETEMVEIIQNAPSAVDANVELIGLANRRGSPDNISVITIKTDTPELSVSAMVAPEKPSTLEPETQHTSPSVLADLPVNRCVLLELWVIFIPFENKLITMYKQQGSVRVLPIEQPNGNLFQLNDYVVQVQQMPAIEGIKWVGGKQQKRVKAFEIPDTVKEIIRANVGHAVKEQVDELGVDALLSEVAGAGNDRAHEMIVKQFRRDSRTVLSFARQMQNPPRQNGETPYDLNLCTVELLVLYHPGKKRTRSVQDSTIESHPSNDTEN